jgi:hypothetical protein
MMQDRPGTDMASADRLAWLPAAGFVAVAGATVVGLVAPLLGADAGFDRWTATIALIVLLWVSIANVAVVRFMVLPKTVAQGEAARDSARVLGFAYGVAPAMYGVVIAILAGQGLLVLPFAAFSVLSLIINWSFLQEAFPR